MTIRAATSWRSAGMVRIASWNVNSVKARLSHLTKWLKESKPDIALLQGDAVLDAQSERVGFVELLFE